MKTTRILAAVAVALALGVSAATAAATTHLDRTKGLTTDRNPLGDYEGYCTWGAQEQIHDHTGYYVRALTGNADDWARQAQAGGWTVVGDAQPHSIAVYPSALVGGVGHVAWVDSVRGRNMTIIDMNDGVGATAANGFRTSGFHQFGTHTVPAGPGISYILIP
jgi:surface antigen